MNCESKEQHMTTKHMMADQIARELKSRQSWEAISAKADAEEPVNKLPPIFEQMDNVASDLDEVRMLAERLRVRLDTVLSDPAPVECKTTEPVVQARNTLLNRLTDFRDIINQIASTLRDVDQRLQL